MFRPRPKAVSPEWLVVGLGNPGGEYRGTRHNVGFEVIERLADRNRIRLDVGRHSARIGLGEVGGRPVALAKPTTYMNLSGRAVAPLARQYALPPERILVVADDLDLPVGRTRLRAKGSAGGHNGHKSIGAALGTFDYPRLKIGIGSVDRARTIDHVLSRFERGERDLVDAAIDRAVSGIEILLERGFAAAANSLNAYE